MRREPVGREDGLSRGTLRRWASLSAAVALLGATSGVGAAEALASAPAPRGDAGPGLAAFDRLLESFIAEKEIPGAALAIAKDGRLLLARAYGWADAARSQPVEPTSLFRVASVSKPFTAVAVLRLAATGKLPLDAKIVDLLGPDYPAPADPRWRNIRLLELLHHRGGFDRDQSLDPMFASEIIVRELGVPPPAKPRDVIRFMLGRPLDFDPGARYAYSNFGYCLLGRAIERATGKSYEDAVRELVLAPLGIRRMRLGRTLREDRAPGEVEYLMRGPGEGTAVMGPVGKSVPWPYGAWCLETMDAHGGWIASAPDLVRFASDFRDRARSTLLRPEWVDAMLARYSKADTGARYYASGWMMSPAGADGRWNFAHNGSLDGTESYLVLRPDGVSMAVIFNIRNEYSKRVRSFVSELEPLLHQAASEVTEWPALDLFAKFSGQGAGEGAR